MSKRSRAKRAARQGRDERTEASRVIRPVGQTPTHMQTAPTKPKAAQPRKRTYRATRTGEPLEPLNDALTGEPLSHGTLRLWIRDYDAGRELYRGEPIPYSLHSREMETGGGASLDYLGAHVLSKAALRYFAHAVVSASQRIDGLHAWWLDGYVVGRLTVRFGERVVMSAAAYERGDVELREIARLYGVTTKRVASWRNMVQSAARVYFRQGAQPRREPVRIREQVDESAETMPASA